MLFNPTRDQVRLFFTEIWRKHQQAAVLTPLEAMALDWMLEHPEYHAILADPDKAQADFTIESGQTNPFLHLSMHLAIAEQLQIDQPPGIKAAYQQLARRSDAHQAAHEVMECLGQVLWESQRLGTPLDNALYLELIQKRAQG